MSLSLEQLTLRGIDYIGKGDAALLIPKPTLPTDPHALEGKKILLRRGGALGDTIFVLGVAQAIKALQPRC